MKNITLSLGLLVGTIALCPVQLLATVTITRPTGGQNISDDKAVNSTNGAAFTALGNIVLTEGATTDFAVGNNQTLILTLHAGVVFPTPPVVITYFQYATHYTLATVTVSTASLIVRPG